MLQCVEYSEPFGIICQTSEIAVGLSQIRAYHFRTNIQSKFVSVLHCIANTSLHISNTNMIPGYLSIHNAELKVLFLPIEQFYRKCIGYYHFPFVGNGNAKGRWNSCRKLMVRPGIV